MHKPISGGVVQFPLTQEAKPDHNDGETPQSEEAYKAKLRGKYKDLKSKALADASDALPTVLIENILFQRRRMLLCGASKGRKTWLCMQIAFCLSKGLALFGRFKTEKTLVLYGNLELLEATAKRRFRAIADALECRSDDPFENLRIVSATEYLDKIGNDFSDFLALQAADDKAKVVCIDPVWRLLGEREENSNTGIGQVLKPFARFSREAEASAIGVHHYAKGNPAAKEAIDRGAGAGAWARDAATLLMVTNHREKDAHIVDIYTNDFAPIDKFVLRFNYPIFELAPDLNPEEMKTPARTAKAAETKKSDQQTDTILAVLYTTDQEGGLTHGEIVHFTTYPKSSVTKILKALIDATKVVKLVGSETPKYALSVRYRAKMDEENGDEGRPPGPWCRDLP
jgi:RecA-family ATPase